jgi:hypothetical protein
VKTSAKEVSEIECTLIKRERKLKMQPPVKCDVRKSADI